MPDTRAQQIAQIVRRARAERNLTQDQLADMVGVNKQTIYHIEAAKHQARPELISKLEDALDVDLGALSLAGQAAIDAVVLKLAERMRELGEVDGFRFASQVLDFVDKWKVEGSSGG